MSKFNINDKVRVKKDLIINEVYYNENGSYDYFSYGMASFRDKVGIITHSDDSGYSLDIGTFYTFTDDMLESVSDDYYYDNYKEDEFDKEINKLFDKYAVCTKKEMIDDVLDRMNNGEYDDGERLNKLTNDYRNAKNTNKY